MSRWLVTGAGGMLGTDVMLAVAAAGHESTGLTRSDLDVTDPEACRRAVDGADVVVNCAAWTDVDGAEAHEAEAFFVNAVGARNLAVAACEVRAAMVQMSTDYIFAGDAHEPYPTDAPVAPLNAYGRTKAAGEWAVRAECPRSYVVRTAWLFGRNGRNFVDTMLRLSTERDHVDVVSDQQGQPTWTRDLADALVALVDDGARFGTHHATTSGETSWYGLARAVFEEAGLDPERVRPTTSDAFRRPAPRPQYSVLGHDDMTLPHWRDSVRRYLTLGAAPAAV